MTAPYVICQRIVKVYRVGEHELVALRGVDFQMERGEMVAIIGPSGAGKSSLLNLLGGLDVPTAGQLTVGGLNLLDLRGRALSDYRLKRVGFVWQQVERNLLGHRTAHGNVTLPMMLAGVPPWMRNQRARDLLEAVGIADQAHKRPSQLSGGQQQRVAMAVALANQPPLLLADEPTGALDRHSAAQVMALLNELRNQLDLTVLMVTHDLNIAAHADRVLTLRDGALGQDVSAQSDETPQLGADGSIRLPGVARGQLADADRIAVEIRPEGVLLRAEREQQGEDVNAMAQDSAPETESKQRLFRFGRRKREKAGA
jgi:ABC-type lipoprotein export system ATPase subunit